MISGKGTAKKKMRMKAAAARIVSRLLVSARRAIRRTASTTIARTAALTPKKIASTGPTLPRST
jgi:hypothetical protein